VREPKIRVFNHCEFCWNDVYPGDFISAPGTIAYYLRDYETRDEKTKVLSMGKKLMFVLSVTGNELLTYIVLTRHGILVINSLRINSEQLPPVELY